MLCVRAPVLAQTAGPFPWHWGRLGALCQGVQPFPDNRDSFSSASQGAASAGTKAPNLEP